MAIRELQVFLASRFDEFADLRSELRERINRVRRPEVRAVDLNDNLTDPHPPIVRCYEAIDSAEVVVLLVGEIYGEELDGHDCSYTHLEYRHALEDHSKIILPFLIGASHLKSPDQRLRDWVKEIMRNHCVSRLNLTHGYQRLASDIFEALYERLWEVAAEGETVADDELNDDESVRHWDESPIKRDQLVVTGKAHASSQLLKLLAAGHAHEAFDALALNMPQIAIQQLGKAVALSPLEVVPTYWLARLLIATGRIPDCREGLRLALRCTRVAARRDDVPDLVGMASLILAARSSERLYDREGALRYARHAHEEAPFHWLAKVELGRQLALNGLPADAITYAEQAFWLRPDAIDKIVSDPAYRDIGPPFDRFCERLRGQVRSETEAILAVEELLELAASSDGGDELPQREEGKKPAGTTSLLAVVHRARASSRRSLGLVRTWGGRLVSDIASFGTGRFRGLTELTNSQIAQSIESETANVASFTESLRREEQKAAKERRQTQTTASIGVFVVLLLGAGIWVSATNSQWLAMVGFGLLLLLVVWVFGAACLSGWSRCEATLKNCTGFDSGLRAAQLALAEFKDAKRQFAISAEALREELRCFCHAVNAFEVATGERLPFAPAVPRRRANTTEIIRLDEAEAASDDVVVDSELLPPDLKYLLGDASPPKAPHWFARRVAAGPPDVLNRRAAYFSP
jgi:tetratricopeptide (TPR) repeat protein